jgi:putative peptidoglycan lipid II flippase
MTWYQFGWFEAYLAAGRYADVLALAEATLKSNPYSEEMYYYTGRVYAAQGDSQAARTQYHLALEHNPNFAAAQQALAALGPKMKLAALDRRVIVSAGIVAAGFTAAKFTGVLDDFIVARLFGAGRELDAYYVAFGWPDFLFTLIAGWALGAAFIPVFTSYLVNADHATAWQLASYVINLAFLVTLAASLLTGLAAPWLMQTIIAPGFDPAQQWLAANLMRIILISTAIFSISGIVMGTLQAHEHFWLPALAPVMYNLGIIGGALFLTRPFGVYGLAIGVVIGAALHLLIQVPGLVKFGARWTPRIDWRAAGLRRVLQLLGPRVVGLGAAQISLLVTNNLASQLEQGSVANLAWAWRLLQMPETIIATAIGTVIFPTLSALAAQGQSAALRTTLHKALALILLINIPAALGLIIFGQPIAGLAFGTANAAGVAFALQFYAIGLIGRSALEVTARAFYAQQDTRTPLLVAVVAMSLGIAASWLLMRPLSYGGLALGQALGFTAEALVLTVLLERRLQARLNSA